MSLTGLCPPWTDAAPGCEFGTKNERGGGAALPPRGVEGMKGVGPSSCGAVPSPGWLCGTKNLGGCRLPKLGGRGGAQAAMLTSGECLVKYLNSALNWPICCAKRAARLAVQALTGLLQSPVLPVTVTVCCPFASTHRHSRLSQTQAQGSQLPISLLLTRLAVPERAGTAGLRRARAARPSPIDVARTSTFNLSQETLYQARPIPELQPAASTAQKRREL